MLELKRKMGEEDCLRCRFLERNVTGNVTDSHLILGSPSTHLNMFQYLMETLQLN